MLRKKNAEMVLPMNAVKMTEDEMMYVEGGKKTTAPRISGYSSAVRTTVNTSYSSLKGSIVSTVLSAATMHNATTPYNNRRTTRGGNVYYVSYKPSSSDKKFAKALCKGYEIGSYFI